MASSLRVAAALAVIALAIIVVALYLVVPGSDQGGGESVRLIVSTTTSLYTTGLLDALASNFTKNNSDIIVQYVAVGSGEALKRAERGDACAVVVHAPSLERNYIEKGILDNHRIIAYNYFVLVGPADDPAGVRDADSVVEAFRRIYAAGEEGRALFISRGDMSGTHVKELSIWEAAGLEPRGREWYIEAGQGMGQTLVIASERGAYTLSDIGTYLMFLREGRITGLTVLYSGDPMLLNIYSAYTVTLCSGREAEAARQYVDFLASPEGQQVIAKYGVDRYGEPLFYPAQDNLSWLEAEWKRLAGGG